MNMPQTDERAAMDKAREYNSHPPYCGCTRCLDVASLVHRQREEAVEQARPEIERKALAKYRWRPIAEIHEDCGQCVVMRIGDPGALAVTSCLDQDFDESDWTHFAKVPELTCEEAARLEDA
jgi:hypothetical protein